MAQPKGAKVTICGRDFVIACEEEERDRLAAAVSMVESRLDEVQRHGKVIGLDRCALLAALNIASDLLELSANAQGVDEVGSHIHRIRSKIDAAIDEQSQLLL